MRNKFLMLIVFISLLLSVCGFANSNQSSQVTKNNNFIAFSDIHFDPFHTCQKNNPNCLVMKLLISNNVYNWHDILQQYDTGTVSQYHTDTNYPLLQSVLAALHEKVIQQSPDFVIILGDLLAHNFQKRYQYYSGDYTQAGYQAFVKKTMQFLTTEIQTAIPDVPIYPALGNNDSYNGDYGIVPNGLFFHDITNMWVPLLGKHVGTFTQTFPIAGYYALTPLANKNMRIIILNSVLFTPQAYDRQIDSVVRKQLIWLAQQLSLARKQQQKVWLVMHVPPGINIYNTVMDPSKHINSFWRREYLQTFLNILDKNATTVSAILTSHIHMDGLQIISSTHPIADSFVPGISPLFGNNPGFKVYSYSRKSLQLQNITTYYLADNNIDKGWQLEYNFNDIYHPGCRTCTLIKGMQNISAHGNLAQAYQRFYAMSNMDAQPITKGKWLPYYWCGIHHLFEAEYQRCLSEK